MFALILILCILAFIVIMGLVTQVILPARQGTPFFPIFRKPSPLEAQVKEAAQELAETAEYVSLKEELKELNRRKAELEGK